MYRHDFLSDTTGIIAKSLKMVASKYFYMFLIKHTNNIVLIAFIRIRVYFLQYNLCTYVYIDSKYDKVRNASQSNSNVRLKNRELENKILK